MTTTEGTERTTAGPKSPWNAGRFFERLVRYLGLAMVFLGLAYYTSAKGNMDPMLIRVWLVVWVALVITQITLDVRNRR